jgi:hypothetical protein
MPHITAILWGIQSCTLWSSFMCRIPYRCVYIYILLQWRITVDFLIDGFVYLSSRESLVSKKCILFQRSHHILESTSYKMKNAYGLLSIWSYALESLCLLQKIHILNWHVCYSRYLYIPLGGSKWRFLNVWVIFTFVAIWHDLEWWVPY